MHNSAAGDIQQEFRFPRSETIEGVTFGALVLQGGERPLAVPFDWPVESGAEGEQKNILKKKSFFLRFFLTKV